MRNWTETATGAGAALVLEQSLECLVGVAGLLVLAVLACSQLFGQPFSLKIEFVELAILVLADRCAGRLFFVDNRFEC